MNEKKRLVDVVQLVHGWATVDVKDSGKILIHGNLIDALKTRSQINDGMLEPYDYWLIDGLMVREPGVEGNELGTINDVNIKNKSVLRMSMDSYEYLKTRSSSKNS